MNATLFVWGNARLICELTIMRPLVIRSRQSGLNALKGGIRVDRAPIEFYRAVVHYANGRSEEVDVRQRIPAGGQTRSIDLRGDERAIDSVEFFYARGRWGYGREPRVRLYDII